MSNTDLQSTFSTRRTHRSPTKVSKFTRGEKCIFVHLVITFSVLIILLIIYFAHLSMVNHSEKSALQISRRKMVQDDRKCLSSRTYLIAVIR